MDASQIVEIVGFVLTVIVGFVSGYAGGWQVVKLKLRQAGKLIADLNEGLTDDKVSEAEWQLWWLDLKELLGLK
jgi:hypothetical protein